MRFIAAALTVASLLVVMQRLKRDGSLGWIWVRGAFQVRSALTHVAPFWKNRLYTPTLLTKIDSRYFIIDCWHNRVLYSPAVDAPLSSWRVLDDDLAGPHSIASDSVLYAVEDTGRDSLRVYRYRDGTFRRVQTIANLGTRTHRVRYDPATSAFYVLSSQSQIITKLIRRADQLEIVYQKPLPFLKAVYTRSFTIAEGFMYFVSGPKTITKARYLDDSYEVVATYDVPPVLASMNDLFKSGRYFYLTATPKLIVRTTSLETLRDGKWEDLYGTLGFRGTPYSLAEFDGRLFVPQITEYSGILSFAERDGAIAEVRTLVDSGPPSWLDEQVGLSLPK